MTESTQDQDNQSPAPDEVEGYVRLASVIDTDTDTDGDVEGFLLKQ